MTLKLTTILALMGLSLSNNIHANTYDPQPYKGVYGGTLPSWEARYYIDLPEFDLMDSLSGYSSDFDYYDDINGYIINSHRNPSCINNTSYHGCRKGMIRFKRPAFQTGKTRKHEFAFTIKPGTDFPDFAILFQDWVDVDGKPHSGHRPITTLKIRKCNDGQFYLQHYDNSWQLQNKSKPAIADDVCGQANSTRTDTLHGSMRIDTFEGSGSSTGRYYVDIITRDSTRPGQPSVEVYVDNKLLSKAYYPTTHPTEQHIVMSGLYWTKGYNIEHNPNKAITLTMWNFNYSEY